MNTCLVVSKDRDDFLGQVQRHLTLLGIKVVEHADHADFTIVMGGDGTVLGAARTGVRSPVVVINTGTLGFLTSSSKEKAIETIERVLLGEFTVTTRHLLTAEVGSKFPMFPRKTYHALNDIVIRPKATDERNLNKLIRLSLYAQHQGEPEFLVTTYRADGLIVSSPTGSTAYSLSASGPIIHPLCKSFCVTPICPQGLSQRPLVLPHDIQLRIVPQDTDLYLSVDSQVGQAIEASTAIRVWYNEHTIQTVNPIQNYFEVLQEKLGWGHRVR